MFGLSVDGMKSFHQYRKRVYTQDRCPQAPIKKRKLFDYRSSVVHDKDASSDSFSNSPEKGMCMDKSDSDILLEKGTLSCLLLKVCCWLHLTKFLFILQ